jgi:prepilin-type N-terminal cleavage/methylation domain-containing protein
MMRRPSSAAGFTLLEILVVTGIIGVVSTIGVSTLLSVTSAWNERKAITDLDAQAEQALHSIRGDLAAALSYEVSGIPIQGSTREVSDDRTYPPARHRDDDLTIPVHAIDPSRPLAVPGNVGYRIERTGATGHLIRTIGPLGQGFPAGNRLDLLPEARVLGFSVEFLAPGPDALWVDGWDHAGMPAAVRVSLAIQDVGRPNQDQVTRQAVVPVHVR